MSQFAHYRFLTNNMLTTEEREHKEDEISKLTGEVLDARCIECDSRISTVSLDELKEILEVRKKYKKKKNKRTIIKKSSYNTEPAEEEQIQYIR
ncbi:MAG TPA: hypothetical protein VIP70_06075 [Nitrososphaeraceae archaeon]